MSKGKGKGTVKVNGKARPTKSAKVELPQEFMTKHGEAIRTQFTKTPSWMGVLRATKLNDVLVGAVLVKAGLIKSKDKRVVAILKEAPKSGISKATKSEPYDMSERQADEFRRERGEIKAGKKVPVVKAANGTDVIEPISDPAIVDVLKFCRHLPTKETRK